ncbi:hypothetical protein TrLO_g7967 [Triparma laevis f. longispina]|nr:hypothetical protein TrLO_g7967 [Triparma laevis f. longispina]
MNDTLTHWVNTGLDGIMLDWPQAYVSANTPETYQRDNCKARDTCDATIINDQIKAVMKPLGDIMVMGEAEDPTITPWEFLEALDGYIVEPALAMFDQVIEHGGVPRGDLVVRNDDGGASLLKAAYTCLIGAYYALEGTGEKPVNSGDYGDFGDWDGEQEGKRRSSRSTWRGVDGSSDAVVKVDVSGVSGVVSGGQVWDEIEGKAYGVVDADLTFELSLDAFKYRLFTFN